LNHSNGSGHFLLYLSPSCQVETELGPRATEELALLYLPQYLLAVLSVTFWVAATVAIVI
tara:strand:- start:530 stop:709 length:180 start_codon:yes stop_codon:yes gene_type:complete